MEQQPEKLLWRDRIKHGLSASQFGMALGYCGRVSDFVEYKRVYIGTELEFDGNAATDHGCRTEAKARSCYELATSCQVVDGGFFTTPDNVLACSPDGIVVDDIIGSSATTPKRLLEIKSPFRSLYDGSKEQNKPFGIPKQYMVQMQGQLHLSGASECDFCVFLDTENNCCISAWRVKRHTQFWNWCEPNLRLVTSWIRDGLPEGINRSFEFPQFDFTEIDVVPLIYPFSIPQQQYLMDTVKFPFFCNYAAKLRCDSASGSDGVHSESNISSMNKSCPAIFATPSIRMRPTILTRTERPSPPVSDTIVQCYKPTYPSIFPSLQSDAALLLFSSKELLIQDIHYRRRDEWDRAPISPIPTGVDVEKLPSLKNPKSPGTISPLCGRAVELDNLPAEVFDVCWASGTVTVKFKPSISGHSNVISGERTDRATDSTRVRVLRLWCMDDMKLLKRQQQHDSPNIDIVHPSGNNDKSLLSNDVQNGTYFASSAHPCVANQIPQDARDTSLHREMPHTQTIPVSFNYIHIPTLPKHNPSLLQSGSACSSPLTPNVHLEERGSSATPNTLIGNINSSSAFPSDFTLEMFIGHEFINGEDDVLYIAKGLGNVEDRLGQSAQRSYSVVIKMIYSLFEEPLSFVFRKPETRFDNSITISSCERTVVCCPAELLLEILALCEGSCADVPISIDSEDDQEDIFLGSPLSSITSISDYLSTHHTVSYAQGTTRVSGTLLHQHVISLGNTLILQMRSRANRRNRRGAGDGDILSSRPMMHKRTASDEYNVNIGDVLFVVVSSKGKMADEHRMIRDHVSWVNGNWDCFSRTLSQSLVMMSV